jgi:cyclopropane fatty-acyl-phospholipid synthase-like methyltransferase
VLIVGAPDGDGRGDDRVLPLHGVEARLRMGARVADLRCGNGRILIRLATAFPRSTFHGFDDRRELIEAARSAAATAGVSDRLTFEVMAATEVPGSDYDLMCFSDPLEDPGTFARVADRVSQVLAEEGTWMVRRTSDASGTDGRDRREVGHDSHGR